MKVDLFSDRFWSKTHIVWSTNDACWEWRANKDKDGYGLFKLNNQTKRAHHVSWALSYGQWPNKDLQLNHTCHNRACIRPDHMYEGTQIDNVKDRDNRKLSTCM